MDELDAEMAALEGADDGQSVASSAPAPPPPQQRAGRRDRDPGRRRRRPFDGPDPLDAAFEAPETRPLACTAWLSLDEFRAPSLDEVRAAQRAGQRGWANSFVDGESNDPEDTDTPRRATQFREAAPSDGRVASGRYCYLCAKQGAPGANPCREQLDAFLTSNLGCMDPSLLCMSAARFYAWRALPYTRQPWGAADVWRHLTEHTINRRALIVDAMLKLQEYEQRLADTALPQDGEGRPLPPNPDHLKAHLQVLRERTWYADRFESLAGNKKQKTN
jgi:hypothetical protein